MSRPRSETQAEAQDRLNDAIRVNGAELRCRVVGEGGNLGCTQKGRVEFALKGGRINTDFIDNSAGVDCSDHEVNIKILLRAVMDAGELTMKQRDELLASMTDEVAELVLRDNVLQNLALSMTEAIGPELLDPHIRLMRRLEGEGRLDREVEDLPSDAELAERRKAGKGLTRPELAVLLAYAKMTLYEDLSAHRAARARLFRARSRQILPAAAAPPLRRADQGAPPQARDRGHLDRQQRGQSRPRGVRLRARGRDRRQPRGRAAGLCDHARRLRAAPGLGSDRGLARQRVGRAADAPVRGGARRGDARHALVRHPGRSAVQDARHGVSLPAGHRDGDGQPGRGHRAAPRGGDRRLPGRV